MRLRAPGAAAKKYSRAMPLLIIATRLRRMVLASKCALSAGVRVTGSGVCSSGATGVAPVGLLVDVVGEWREVADQGLRRGVRQRVLREQRVVAGDEQRGEAFRG